jgi:general secretion pathway protein J
MTILAIRKNGFTLVEVLVALVIMATLALMAWQGVDGIVRTRDASQARLERTLRLTTVLSQWEQDLASLHDTDVVPALTFDGATMRLTRRTLDGVQLVSWTLIPSNLESEQGINQWVRWGGPSVTGSAALQDSWMRSQLLQGNDPGLVRTLSGLTQWQLYCYRGNAWTNCQSSNDVVETVATPASGAAVSRPKVVLPTGIRLVLTFAGGGGFEGMLTRDIALGPQLP